MIPLRDFFQSGNGLVGAIHLISVAPLGIHLFLRGGHTASMAVPAQVPLCIMHLLLLEMHIISTIFNLWCAQKYLNTLMCC